MKNRRFSFSKELKLIAFGVILFWALFNLKSIVGHVSSVLELIFPVLLGILFALIFNVPMSAIERTLFRPNKNNEYSKIKAKIKRPVSLLITLLLVLGMVALVIVLVLPEFLNTIEKMYDKVPDLAEELSSTITGSPLLAKFINPDNWTPEKINAKISGMIENSEVVFKTISGTVSFATTVFSGLLDLVLALFFAVYMLLQKEKLKAQVYRVTYAFFSDDIARRLCYVARLSKETFNKFITGQTIEAFILGLLCCLGMQIFGFPNALEIGVLVMVTAYIPIVGAFIGAAVGAFFIMFTSFKQALLFLLFIVVLQQLEDNLIYPKVVGKTIGLPSLWVLFSIVVGGSMGGILGMFVAVPACSIFYFLIREFISYAEERKKHKKALRAAVFSSDDEEGPAPDPAPPPSEETAGSEQQIAESQ